MVSPADPTIAASARRSGAAPNADPAGPLVATKILVPSPGTALRDRPRLDASLDRGLDDRTRLVLLSAPPGYGKTVAVAGWLASRSPATAWLSLDPADNDLARFVRYLVAALRAVRPGIGGATEDL